VSTVANLGIEIDVPPGWEAAIYRREPDGGGGSTHAVVHLGSFPLPPDRGDFGSGAVDLMTHDDVLAVLLEYDGSSAATALFAEPAMPRQLSADQFSTSTLQRVVPGQAGLQRFFTESGRPFCLYCVVGAWQRATDLVPRLNDALGRVRIRPA
jgi:hypothetical protein